MSMTTMFINFCATIFITFVLTIPFSMLCEVPFINLEKFILFPPKEKPKGVKGVDNEREPMLTANGNKVNNDTTTFFVSS